MTDRFIIIFFFSRLQRAREPVAINELEGTRLEMVSETRWNEPVLAFPASCRV